MNETYRELEEQIVQLKEEIERLRQIINESAYKRNNWTK